MNANYGRLPRPAPGYHPVFRARGGNKRPCANCKESSVELDVAAILYPRSAVVPAKHRSHIAEKLLESPKFTGGSHGDRIVEALEWSIEKARLICEQSLAANQTRIALDALRVIGDIAANEAKIVGAIPKSKSMHVHVPAFTPEQARALLADVAATALPAPEATVEQPASTGND